MSRLKKSGIIWYILLLGWMAFIFIMSAQTSQESSEVSGGIVSKLIAVFYTKFDLLSAEKQAETINIVTVIVRKSAHFLEYFILGLLASLYANAYIKKGCKIKVIYAIVICVLYAVSDEVHQFFVPGRACRFTDVCIDSAGSITAILLIGVIIFKKETNRVKSMRKKKLIEQNLLLFENLQKTQHELSELKKAFNQNAQEMESLKSQLEAAKIVQNEEVVVTVPLRRLEEKLITNAALKPDMEYGAKIIGKIVVSAAEYSNKLTAGGTDKHRELVNLILGKTEIAKAEILSVTEGDDVFDVKCLKIDQIAANAMEYFESVAAQIV